MDLGYNEDVKCGSATYNWGDIIISLGFFRKIIGYGNIVLYSYDENIIDFLKEQFFINKVYYISPSNKEEYLNLPNDINNFINYIKSIINIDIIATHMRKDMCYARYFIPCPKLRLPLNVREWSYNIIKDINKPVFLVNPFSFASVTPENHHDSWMEILEYLSSLNEYYFIISGTSNIIADVHCNGMFGDNFINYINSKKNFINMIDKTPNNMYVFALANECEGTITTTNSLGHWCGNQHVKHVIIKNKVISEAPTTIYNHAFNSLSDIIIEKENDTNECIDKINQLCKGNI